MPPRRRSGAGSSPEHLTAENLETLAAAVAEGKRATVYLREATPSLGIEAGCSAKVVSVEGNTVIIRPKGVNDELPFEAEELRMTRKAPEPVAPSKTPARTAAPARPKAAAPAATRSVAPAPAPATAPAPPKPVAPAPSAARPAPAKTAAPAPAPASAASAPAPAPRRPAKKPQGGVSVTIHAGADNEWTVTVALGAKRPSKAVPVSPDAVDRAVRELGDPAALDAVTSVISAAREAAEERVAALSKELEDARRMLEALGSTT
ncbi:DUF6319 family protein [Rhodococcus sp. SGAir0479]|uniref:DUF6319 family protein n=1 Tax=Rhodococcus sp. SGAir0479 TaxID=2567884 RepID=UPI0010CCD37C|nr:DUF6319 family protein [Rhodococcus sp. SGAir0479]QCQ92750.1 translation initiation factor [Rhodococcus sp. SGAir0479]